MSQYARTRWEENPDFRATVLAGLKRGRDKTNSRDDPEFLEKRAAIFKAARDKAIARWKTDPELRALQGLNAKAQWENPSIRVIRQDALNRGRVKVNAQWYDTDSNVRKAREANLAKGTAALARLMQDPMWRDGRQTGSKTKDLWKNPEYRTKSLVKLKITQAKGAAKVKEMWGNDPVYRKERLTALHASNTKPEFKQRHQQKLKKFWADPEYRKRHSLRMKARWAKYRLDHASKEIV